eukprot:scaffold146734_cov19-Tisochrysis_lutea.AAC.1
MLDADMPSVTQGGVLVAHGCMLGGAAPALQCQQAPLRAGYTCKFVRFMPKSVNNSRRATQDTSMCQLFSIILCMRRKTMYGMLRKHKGVCRRHGKLSEAD